MTGQEIMQAMRLCLNKEGDCRTCNLLNVDQCVKHLVRAATDPHREADRRECTELRKEIEWKDMVIALAERKQTEAEAERDALIKQIKERHDCIDCKHDDYCEFNNANVIDCMNCVQEECPCAGCYDSSRWEWRGLPEAPEEGEKA